MSRYWHRRRRSRKPQPEELVLVLIAMVVLAIYSPQAQTIFLQFWYIYFFAAVILISIFIKKQYEQYKLSKSGIYEVDGMSGTDFEFFLSSLFSKLGYKVQHTGKVGDLGSDLIIEMGGIKIAVQAKRYKENVGPDAIREVNAVVKPLNCTMGMVVTNSFYTNEAIYLAKENNVTLWDRNDLVDNILVSQKQNNLTS